jgi:hypothetical protein
MLKKPPTVRIGMKVSTNTVRIASEIKIAQPASNVISTRVRDPSQTMRLTVQVPFAVNATEGSGHDG